MRRIFLAVLIVAAVAQAKIVDGVAILVKEQPITLYDIEQAMQKEHLPLSKAVDFLIRETLEAMEIKERGIRIGSEEINERIEQMAAGNKLTVSQLYDAIWSTEHLTRDAFREKLRKTLAAQKLYSAIALSALEEPTGEEMREYYRLHPEKFSKSRTFDVLLYESPDKQALEAKIANPMLNPPGIRSEAMRMEYDKINPRLAQMLNKAEPGTFLPLLPNPSGGFVAIYLKSKAMPTMEPYDSVAPRIKEAIMGDEREQTLKDYFDRARMNADIKIIRLPDEELTRGR